MNEMKQNFFFFFWYCNLFLSFGLFFRVFVPGYLYGIRRGGEGVSVDVSEERKQKKRNSFSFFFFEIENRNAC